jgi:mevalonate kinase
MKLKESYPEFFSDYLSAMKHVVDYGQKYLEAGDFKKLGEIMNVNHGLLSAIGVSSPELERLVWAARKVSPGAKLCGSGRGGIMVAVGDAAKEIEAAGGRVIKTKITEEGVRIEKL